MTPADLLPRIGALCVRMASEAPCPICTAETHRHGEPHREDCLVGQYVEAKRVDAESAPPLMIASCDRQHSGALAGKRADVPASACEGWWVMPEPCAHDYHYFPATNEDGWRCVRCVSRPGEPPGFSPALDHAHLERKVSTVLDALHNGDVVYVSNGSEGDSIVGVVAKTCRERGVFDQYSIALFILELMTKSHAKYWREISDGILAGKDPRERCACGKLANSTTWDGDGNKIHAWSFDHLEAAKEGRSF